METTISLLRKIVGNRTQFNEKQNELLENFPNMEITISNFFNPSNPRIPLSDEKYRSDKDYIYSIAQL